jgi:hypothetical protein
MLQTHLQSPNAPLQLLHDRLLDLRVHTVDFFLLEWSIHVSVHDSISVTGATFFWMVEFVEQ